MSELIKKLKEVSSGKGQPLGFGAIAKPKTAPMLLIAQPTTVDADSIPTTMGQRPDALLLNMSNSADPDELPLKPITSAVPWGARLATATTDVDIRNLINAGCDYLVFNQERPAQILTHEKVGKVLEIDGTISDGAAEAISRSPIDAIIIKHSSPAPLNVQHFLDYHRIITMARKPAIAIYAPDASNLELLHETGFSGIVAVPASSGTDLNLADIRAAIDELPKNRKPVE